MSGVVGVLIVAMVLVAASAGPTDRVAADQNLFHLPVIRQFAAQWPRPDLRDYASATSPGYHLLLSLVDRFVTDRVAVLQCVGAVFGVLFVGVLAWGGRGRSALLALPAATSVYVLTSAVWLLPENAAWLGVTVALLLALYADGRRLFIGSAVATAALVFVRQSHVWTLLPFAVGALCASRNNAGRTANWRATWPRVVVSTLFASLPAVIVLAWLVWLWHGLTPPAFRPGSGVELPLATKVGGLAPAAPAMVLSLIGLFGVPLFAWLWPAGGWRRAVRWAAVGGAAGFVIGVLPVTTVDWSRKSGIWNLVQKLPTVADRSPVIVGLATIGGAVAAVTLLRLPMRARWVMAAALVGFTAVQTANVLVWQRYYEPFCLIWLILAAGVPGESDRRLRLWRGFGLAGLTVFQVGVTVYTLRHAG